MQFLSGGNQQKVIIARWLFSQARLLIMDEPTQGIDIGAKQEVYKVINELTASGISILLISSDFPELLAMSDRVAVVRDGRILEITAGNRAVRIRAHQSGVWRRRQRPMHPEARMRRTVEMDVRIPSYHHRRPDFRFAGPRGRGWSPHDSYIPKPDQRLAPGFHVAIVAIGATLVILTGGIDLFPGATVALVCCRWRTW